MNKFARRNIPISELLLDPENARHGLIDGQPEIISWMMREKGDEVYNLAKHITEHGQSPIDLVLVYPSEENPGLYIVGEGNRRITAIKLLQDIALCPDGRSKKRFDTIIKKATYMPDDEIECVVAGNFDEARPWIRLRHSGQHNGAGVLSWGALEAERFNKRISHSGRDAMAVKLLDWAVENSIIDKKNADNFPAITSVTRLLKDPDVRNLLGLEVHDKGLVTSVDDAVLGKMIGRILNEIGSGKVKVDQIKSKDDRIKYIKKLVGNTSFDKNKTVGTPYALDGDPEGGTSQPEAAKAPQKPKQKQNSLDRKGLIPRDFKLRIKNKKLNDIFDELKKIDINKFTNSVSVLARVFIEGCVDEYSTTQNLQIPENAKLINKIQKVLHFQKGQDLYQNFYNAEDHVTLAHLVRTRIQHPWVVSYDNVPQIKRLYSKHKKLSYGIQYSAGMHYEGSELMFFSEKLSLPSMKNPLSCSL